MNVHFGKDYFRDVKKRSPTKLGLLKKVPNLEKNSPSPSVQVEEIDDFDDLERDDDESIEKDNIITEQQHIKDQENNLDETIEFLKKYAKKPQPP